MPKYLIERNIPGAGSLSQQDLQAISQKIMQCAAGPRTRHSVGPELCDL
ncbi:hypothetical protein BH23GEM6_BH23GEM6_19250 [soil metagenome]